jgi:glycosyltransferase involved in cell wall biosynthesis
MQALVRTPKRVFILPQAISKEIGLLLLQWDPTMLKTILKLMLKGMLFSRRTQLKDHYILLKTDHGGFKNPAYIKALQAKRVQVIAVVHDLIPLLHPEYCTSNNTVKFAKSLSTILEHAKGLVTVSEATKDALTDHVHLKQITCPPVITSKLAPGLSFSRSDKEPPLIDGPYFVTISTLGARKNHLLLLQIWRDMVRRLGVNTPKLVIVGKRSRTCEYTLGMLDRCQELRDTVVETTCTDKQLANYLYYAKALLFPSFTEGYGLPLIEALSFKVPVIASNLDVFKEIAGDIPEYFDPLDGLGWMQCIEHYAKEDSPLRQAQMERMANFRVPTWQEHFVKVDAFLNALQTDLSEM